MRLTTLKSTSLFALLLSWSFLGLLPMSCGTEVGNGNRETTPIDSQNAKSESEEDRLETDAGASPNEGVVAADSVASIPPSYIGMIFSPCHGFTDNVAHPFAMTAIYDGKEESDLASLLNEDGSFVLTTGSTKYDAVQENDSVTLVNQSNSSQALEFSYSCNGETSDLPIDKLKFSATHGKQVEIVTADELTTYTMRWHTSLVSGANNLVGLEILRDDTVELTLELSSDDQNTE